MIQQILIMGTDGQDLRSKATGWSAEDPAGVGAARGLCVWSCHEHIGLAPWFGEPYSYSAPLYALADGWRLMAPPTKQGDEWEWWFERLVQ